MINVRQHRNKRISYYLFYSLAFAVITAMVFSWFYLSGRLVWSSDGVRQHLVAMTYYGKYLRQILYNLINTGKIVTPHFDFSVGYGSDVLTTLNWYAIGDPLNLLFAVVPISKAVYLYMALIIFRLYLIGIAFSAYCHKLKLSRSSQLFGSLAYVFCGFVLQAAVHPNFLNPMIYLPLLFIGVEQVLKQQRPYFFIVIVCLAAVTDFYFFYMLTILLILYILIRFFTLTDKKCIKNFFLWASKFALYYLTGLLMACLLFFPVVMYMLSTNRANIHQAVSALYPFSHYLSLLPGLITSNPLGYWVYFGYSAPSVVAIILLFTKRKTHTALKFTLVLLTVLLMLPIVGAIFNGLSYVTNRWIFGYSFVVALITAVMLPDIQRPSKKQLVIVLIVTVLYFLAVTLINRLNTAGFIPAYFAVVFLLLLMWLNYLYRYYRKDKRQGAVFSRVSLFIVLLLMISGFALGAYYRYAPAQGNFVSRFIAPGEATQALTENSSSTIKQLGDKSFYRYDENEFDLNRQEIIQNRSMLQGVNSTGFYFSLTNSHMFDYFIDDIDLFVHQNCNVYTLDNRTFPGTLASVKYFVIQDGMKRCLPYGYNRFVKAANGYQVYKNTYALPLGYSYNKVISRTNYNQFTPVEKQQALLSGAVVDSPATLSLDTTTPAFNDKIIPYQVMCGSGIAYKNNTFVVTQNSASATINFLGLENCETYLYLKNLNYSGGEYVQLPLSINSGKIKKIITYQTPDYSWYADQHDFLVNLGYAARQKTKITIRFGQKGTYSLDDLQVVCQPMSAYPAQIKALKQTTLKHVKIGTDQVIGTVSTNQAKLLCLTIPYSNGWSAQIDGKQVELLNVNTMWCGLYMPAGNHIITLRYETPYFRQGCILSLFGLVLFVVVIVFYERKLRAQTNDIDDPDLAKVDGKRMLNYRE